MITATTAAAAATQAMITTGLIPPSSSSAEGAAAEGVSAAAVGHSLAAGVSDGADVSPGVGSGVMFASASSQYTAMFETSNQHSAASKPRL